MASSDISAVENALSKFPIEARIRSRNVAALGMSVFIESEGKDQFLCWQGSNEQFAQSAVFKQGFDFAKVKRNKWVFPWGLRGDLSRLENGDLKFMISWCYLPSRPITYMRIVRADKAFSLFKERCLDPVGDLKAEEDSD